MTKTIEYNGTAILISQIEAVDLYDDLIEISTPREKDKYKLIFDTAEEAKRFYDDVVSLMNKA